MIRLCGIRIHSFRLSAATEDRHRVASAYFSSWGHQLSHAYGYPLCTFPKKQTTTQIALFVIWTFSFPPHHGIRKYLFPALVVLTSTPPNAR